MEYRGETKDGHIMHGKGTLILRDGKTSFTDEWVNGVCKNRSYLISMNVIKEVLRKSQDKKQKSEKLNREINKDRIIEEGIIYAKKNNESYQWFVWLMKSRQKKRIVYARDPPDFLASI